MIPKIIHYCWFGRNPKPRLAEKCIKSWRKYCPDYEIIEWNEENFDISTAPLYVRQAYEAKKWAYVTDYVRLQVVYDHGGIYLDTDVELRRNLDFLLVNKAYFGFQNERFIATGLGFGAEPRMDILRELMADYHGIPFLREDGTFDDTPCPRRNTEVFLRHGLRQDDSMQIIAEDIVILPSIYLCPIDEETKIRRRSQETVSIHWFEGSWLSEEARAEAEAYTKKLQMERAQEKVRKILGDKLYLLIKKLLKKGYVENAEY